jgi:hypothetical protein
MLNQLIFYAAYNLSSTKVHPQICPSHPTHTYYEDDCSTSLMQVYALPHLPPQLYQLAYPKKLTSSPPSIPGTVATTFSTSGSSLSSTSYLPSVSGITNPMLPPIPWPEALQLLIYNPMQNSFRAVHNHAETALPGPLHCHFFSDHRHPTLKSRQGYATWGPWQSPTSAV